MTIKRFNEEDETTIDNYGKLMFNKALDEAIEIIKKYPFAIWKGSKQQLEETSKDREKIINNLDEKRLPFIKGTTMEILK